MKQHNEQFFQDLAQAYVEHDGKVLHEINLQGLDLPTENLDKRVFFSLQQLKQKRRIRRLTYGLMPVAAVLLVMIIYTAVFPIFQRYETLTDRAPALGIAVAPGDETLEFETDMDDAMWDADDAGDVWEEEVAEAADEPADAPAMDSDDDALLPEEVETEGDRAGFMFSSTIGAIDLPSGFQLVEKTILSETEVSYTIQNDIGNFFYVTKLLITETWEWEDQELQPPDEWEDYWAFYTTIDEMHVLGILFEDVFLTLSTYDDYEALFLLGEAIVARISLP